jgi:hypothetical protein
MNLLAYAALVGLEKGVHAYVVFSLAFLSECHISEEYCTRTLVGSGF